MTHRNQIKMIKSLNADRKLLGIWRSQDSICPICRQNIKVDSKWELHHIKEKSKGGDNKPTNLIMLHPNCHRQVHSQKMKVIKPSSTKELYRRLEPYELKGSSTVLRGGSKGNFTSLLDQDV